MGRKDRTPEPGKNQISRECATALSNWRSGIRADTLRNSDSWNEMANRHPVFCGSRHGDLKNCMKPFPRILRRQRDSLDTDCVLTISERQRLSKLPKAWFSMEK